MKIKIKIKGTLSSYSHIFLHIISFTFLHASFIDDSHKANIRSQRGPRELEYRGWVEKSGHFPDNVNFLKNDVVREIEIW